MRALVGFGLQGAGQGSSLSGKLITPARRCRPGRWRSGADFVVSRARLHAGPGLHPSPAKCNKNTCPTGITTHDLGLQKGLVPQVKSQRVAAYARGIIKDVEVIAHSCGVAAPRQLRRDHVRIVQPDGHSVLMSQMTRR